MNRFLSRREALKSAAVAGATGLLHQADSQPQESMIQVAGRTVEIAVTAVSEYTVRITVQPILKSNTETVLHDGALLKEHWGEPAARVVALPAPKKFTCGNLQVQLSDSPLRISLTDQDGRPVQELHINRSSGDVSFALGSGPLLGLGQGGPQFDRRGKLDNMNSGQTGYHLATNGAKVPIQLLIDTSGWSLFVHQPLGTFDLTGQVGVLRAASQEASLPIDIFVIGTRGPQQILGEYAALTGPPEMVPLWSLGYQQSHRTLSSPEEIIQEAKTFREKLLPCDAMIYLGTGFCPEGWNRDNGEFTWNPRMFPDPQNTIDQLHAEHFKVVLHIVIEGERLTGTVHDPCTASTLPSGKTPDGHWPPNRQVSCYWPFHEPLFKQNVDGWWPDQGDGFDAPSRLARNRMYFEGSQLYRPNERVYALHRNAYAGVQRYASFLWSGDVQSTWETLKVHVAVGINAGLSGIPYWGTDIGGFVPTKDYSGELFVRWFQFAAFTPLFRSHGRDWRLHLPWGWTVGEIGYQETPGYQPSQSVLHDPAVEPICKKYLEIRYQLMPYLYSAVKETCESGLPIIRALWLHYPEDPVAVGRGDEYLFGRDLLVAPIVEKAASSRTLYLPGGLWYDFWTQRPLAGGREITRKVDLTTIPLFCRAGAIVPMGPIKQYTSERVDAPTKLVIFPGADGKFSLYEDDGKTFNYRSGEYSRINMSWNDGRKQLTLSLAANSRMLATTTRHFVVQVAGQPGNRELNFEGRSTSIHF